MTTVLALVAGRRCGARLWSAARWPRRWFPVSALLAVSLSSWGRPIPGCTTGIGWPVPLSGIVGRLELVSRDSTWDSRDVTRWCDAGGWRDAGGDVTSGADVTWRAGVTPVTDVTWGDDVTSRAHVTPGTDVTWGDDVTSRAEVTPGTDVTSGKTWRRGLMWRHGLIWHRALWRHVI